MKRRSAFAFLAAALLGGAARADILPDGQKGVGLSIRVDAEVPAGKTLILAHTFRVMDVIKPGAAAEVEWHPFAGDMVIMSVPSSSIGPKFEEQRKAQDSKPLEEIVKSGKPCHKGFAGIRTVPEGAAADDVRWIFKVTFSGDECTATLTAMEFFDKSGKTVPSTGIPNLPAVPGVAPSGTASAAPKSTGSAASTAAPSPAANPSPSPEAQKGACGCEVGPGAASSGAGAGLFAALGVFFGARARKRRLPAPGKANARHPSNTI